MKKRIFCTLLVALVCVSALSGCGKDNSAAVSFDYDAWLKEQAKLEDEQPVIWLYGSDQWLVNEGLWNYDAASDRKIQVKIFSEDEMDLGQFQTKLQAALMSKDGPDLVLSGNPDLLDVQKTIAAGAFQSWDAILADWDKEDYYAEAVDGSRFTDGKAYLLPLVFDPDLIVTTKTNMQKYGFSEEDFADFDKTADTVLRIWKQLEKEGNDRSFAYVNDPSYIRSVSSVMNWDARKTGLLDPDVQQLFDKWGSMLPYRKQCKSSPQWLFQHGELLFDGSRVLDFTTYYELKSILGMRGENTESGYMIDTIDNEQFDELVFFPMRDTDGKMTCTIKVYALLPARCKNIETIRAYIEYLVQKDDNAGTGAMIGKKNEDEQLSLLTYDISKEIHAMFHQPMRATICNSVMRDYENRISLYANGVKDPSCDDWEDLETDINIYLSE